MSNNIEEDKRTLEMIRNVFEHLINYGWINDIKREINPTNAVQAIENILADRERLEKENKEMKIEIAKQVYFGSMPLDQMKQLQSKANKYDSLVEKIKEKKRYFEEYDELIASSNDNYSDGTVIKRFIDTFQELLEEGEKE